MSEDDRVRWNAIWAERAELGAPAAFVVEHAALLPAAGRALDVAGGAGRHAIWLARRGLDVALVDVSDVAIEQAVRHAADAGVPLAAVRLDLDAGEPLPPGPFDLILCFHYLDRSGRDAYAARLAPGGLVILAQPTVTNLERHDRPSRRFLVEPGELAGWARRAGLEIVVAREGWNAEGRHEAELIARRR